MSATAGGRGRTSNASDGGRGLDLSIARMGGGEVIDGGRGLHHGAARVSDSDGELVRDGDLPLQSNLPWTRLCDPITGWLVISGKAGIPEKAP